MILTTANQDVPDLRLYTPILLIDVGNMPIIYSTETADRIMCKGGIS